MLEGFDINQVLALVLVMLVVRGVRWFARTRFWQRVLKNAKVKRETPGNGIEDEETAVEAALLDEQRPTIQRVARALRASIQPPPTIGPDDDTPRLLRAVKPSDDER